MRSRPALLVAGLCLIAGAAYAPVAIARQTSAVRTSADTTHRSVPPHAGRNGYSSDERDFTIGRSVYLRSTKTHIGRILATDDAHEFPPAFRASPAKAVLIHVVDGPFNWTPLDGLSRIYVVR